MSAVAETLELMGNPAAMQVIAEHKAGRTKFGRLDEAREHAELAVEVAPAAAHELLVKVALERGDLATARREAQREALDKVTVVKPAPPKVRVRERPVQLVAK